MKCRVETRPTFCRAPPVLLVGRNSFRHKSRFQTDLQFVLRHRACSGSAHCDTYAHSLRLAQQIRYFWRLTLLGTAVRMLSRSYREIVMQAHEGDRNEAAIYWTAVSLIVCEGLPIEKAAERLGVEGDLLRDILHRRQMLRPYDPPRHDPSSSVVVPFRKH